MMEFLRNMRDAKSVAKIEGAILALDGDHEAAMKGLARAREALEAAIDAGDPRALETAERAIDDARRSLERLEVARASLERRLIEAREREAAEKLEATIKAAAAKRDAARRRIDKELVPALRTACDVLQSIADADRAVGNANQEIMSAKAGAFLEYTEEKFTPYPENAYGPVYYIINTITIPSVEHWRITGWNAKVPPFNVNALNAMATPPGSVGGKGDMPRAHVLRPAVTPGFAPTND